MHVYRRVRVEPTPEPPILTHELTMRYLDLRRQGLVGQLWSEAGVYYISPVGALHGYSAREFIAYKDLVELIQDAGKGDL